MARETLDLDEIGTFVALGHTFASHRQHDRAPKWPILWTVPGSSVIAEEEPVRIPSYVEEVVPGAELAVVLGEPLWQASESEAREAIAGFTVSNDVRIKGPFPGYPYGDEQEHAMGRGYHVLPTFSPTLTSVAPIDPDEANDLGVEIRIDGESIFAGSTADMDWHVVDLVRHVSTVVALDAGDVISLGDASDPTTYLEDADEVACEIEGVGTLRNPIQVEDAPFDPTSGPG